MAGKDWYTKFEHDKWKADPGLALCCAATRGVWIEMIGSMMQLGSGKLSGTLAEHARLARLSEADIEAALIELHKCDVAEVHWSARGGVERDKSVTVTVVSRYLSRMFEGKENAKNQARLRQQKHRSRSCHAPRHGDVTRHSNSNSKSNTKNPPNPPAGGTGIEFPAGLRTEPFASAWREWEQHRREKRAKLGATTVQRQLALLASVGHDRAIACIQRSIEQGYTGLFPDSIPANAKPRNDSRVRVLDQNATDALQWLQGQSHQVREQVVRQYRTTSGGSTASTEDIVKLMPPKLVAIVNEYRQKGAA